MPRGLVTYPGTGTVDGQLGDLMLFGPPMTMTREQIDDLITILDASITAVESQL